MTVAKKPVMVLISMVPATRVRIKSGCSSSTRISKSMPIDTKTRQFSTSRMGSTSDRA